jgi:eukaryotic translation initiation factor 2C
MANKPGYEEDSVEAFACNFLESQFRGESTPRPNLENLNSFERDNLGKELKGLKIRFERPDGNKRDYKANGLGPDANENNTVVTDQGKYSLVRYYRETYNYTIRQPHLPSLHVGNPSRNIFLPIELCK